MIRNIYFIIRPSDADINPKIISNLIEFHIKISSDAIFSGASLSD